MESPTEPHPPLTAEERTLAALELLGQEFDGLDADGSLDGQLEDHRLAHHVRAADRVRRLPEALLLTAGYYVSRVPVLSEFIRRLD